MTNDKIYREFWLVREVITNSYCVSETKVPWKEIKIGDERIHVIEHSAYLALQKELDAARDKLIKLDATWIEQFYPMKNERDKLQSRLEKCEDLLKSVLVNYHYGNQNLDDEVWQIDEYFAEGEK